MTSILQVKTGNSFTEVPALVGPQGATGATGPQGPKGDPGNISDVKVNGTSVVSGTTASISILNYAYPIGSIYLTINSANPSTYFGGTWVAWGTGRVPVGVDTNDSNFNTVEKTGGSSAIQSHSHSVSITSGNQSADHTHSYSHTHGIDHTHTYSHTHTTPETACTVSTPTLTGSWNNNSSRFPGTTSFSGVFANVSASRSNYWNRTSSSASNTVGFSINATHTHTATVPAMTTNSQNTSTTGGASNTSTTSQSTSTSGGQSVNHTHTVSGNTGNTGSGSAGNLQPYITCYMWKRTA